MTNLTRQLTCTTSWNPLWCNTDRRHTPYCLWHSWKRTQFTQDVCEGSHKRHKISSSVTLHISTQQVFMFPGNLRNQIKLSVYVSGPWNYYSIIIVVVIISNIVFVVVNSPQYHKEKVEDWILFPSELIPHHSQRISSHYNKEYEKKVTQWFWWPFKYILLYISVFLPRYLQCFLFLFFGLSFLSLICPLGLGFECIVCSQTTIKDSCTI